MKKLVMGILAHVDAGKTTLSESILYRSGSIRELGRVDHGNAFLDTFELERLRGITIFSKQAVFTLGDKEVTLLDTPGHVDFSAEMERTLQVMDYAILVINGAEGVQGHTETLWKLLEHYHIPVFLFINKMDQAGTDPVKVLADLKHYLEDGCMDFGKEQDQESMMENIALCKESLMDQYLETGKIERNDITQLIREREIFPCFFGSALKLTGIDEFLQGLQTYMEGTSYPEQFGARIYKVSRDEQDNRLTHMKITGGSLIVKTLLTNKPGKTGDLEESLSSDIWREKVNQIRIYSGAKYHTVNEAEAGTVCAVTGLGKTKPGEGLGIEAASGLPVLEPVLTYQIQLPDGCDVFNMFLKLRILEEEEPQLHIIWNEQTKEIHVQLMGEVQTEILKSIILERFQVPVEFSVGNILYKETILEPVTGAGHFEPLRHYAEVHLLLEPLEPGSGLQFNTSCSEDILDRNWQRLVLTHLQEKEHKGVLTGSSITDMKITLLAGRAHQKHTEGGDFREATYRALRQGLMKAKNVLLEPYYDFRMEVPSEMIGRAMSDVQKGNGTFQPPEIEHEMATLIGSAPVASLQNYQLELQSYTGGRGRFFARLKGYEPCHNSEEVIKNIAYDEKTDLDNPSGSVFCSHGAGFTVDWDQVEQYMHVDNGQKPDEEEREHETKEAARTFKVTKSSDFWKEEKELEEIFKATYRANKQISSGFSKTIKTKRPAAEIRRPKKQKSGDEYLLVDGYNIIFDWEELKELAKENIAAARDKLADVLCNYQGFTSCILILVFDAYNVDRHMEEILQYRNIFVVYTKEAETADQYIEKTVHRMGKKHQVTVATSDRLEQMIISGEGGLVLSAKGLKKRIEEVRQQIREEYMIGEQTDRNYLFRNLSEDMGEYLEEVRLGKKDLK